MKKIEWQKEWDVGVAKIDFQHKSFAKMFNSFVTACEEDEPNDLLYPTLKEMLDYLTNHFADEEAWMLKVSYDDFAAHLKEHRSFTEQTNAFVTRYFEGDDSITEELCNFLHDWFVGHVIGTDRKYVPAFQKWLAQNPDLPL